MRTLELGGALCLRLDTAPQAVELNRAVGLGLSDPATEAGLDEALRFMDGTSSAVAVTPDAQPPELRTWLEARGFGAGYGWTKFIRPAADPPPSRTALRVEKVEEGRAFGDAFVRGYGLPGLFGPWLARLPGREGWHCYVGFDGETPAASGALYVTGEVGWLGLAATVPEHRGKGAQGAILSARIEAAADAGCSVVVTETGEPRNGQPGASYRNILRAGFEPQYVRANYVRSTTAS
jgi:GNAT superfamily N-acetyltransferase